MVGNLTPGLVIVEIRHGVTTLRSVIRTVVVASMLPIKLKIDEESEGSIPGINGTKHPKEVLVEESEDVKYVVKEVGKDALIAKALRHKKLSTSGLATPISGSAPHTLPPQIVGGKTQGAHETIDEM